MFLKTRIKEPPGSTKGPEVFQAVIRLVQNNLTHPRSYTNGLFRCLTITVIYQNRIFAFLIIPVINAMPGERVWSAFWYPPHSGYHLLETAVRRTGLAAFLGSIGPVTKWNRPGYQPGTLHSIYLTAVGLRSLLLLLPLLKRNARWTV